MAPKKLSEAQRAASLARIESIRESQLVPLDPKRDQAIEEIWAKIWNGIDTHITDKQYYPRYVAYAVGHTVAQMVSMVCFAPLNRMNGWDHPIPGQHLEEWDENKECDLPPIDSWARQCIPIETKPRHETALNEDEDDDIDSKARAKAFSKYRSSETMLASIQEALDERRGSVQLQFQPKPTRGGSKPLDTPAEAEKFFTEAMAGWQKTPIEESSESEDEREAGGGSEGEVGGERNAS